MYLAQCTFNWNTLVTGHKQEAVSFPERIQIPRLSANFSFNICTSKA